MLSSSQLRRVWAPACRGPWARISLYGAGKVYVRPATIEAVKALDSCLRSANYKTRSADTGAYACRGQVGSGRTSLHAYGIALDINWQSNPYNRRLITNMPASLPASIVRIRTNNGRQVWNWGGYWSGTKDAMHYEVVCSPADLATGINWRTVNGSSPAPPKPIDWKALRRLAAAQLIDGVKKAPNMGPGHTGPGAYGADMYVAVIQKALNLVTGSKLKENGVYEAWTEGVIKNFQNFVTKVIKGKMTDPAGHFREYTRFYLVAALENIRDGKA